MPLCYPEHNVDIVMIMVPLIQMCQSGVVSENESWKQMTTRKLKMHWSWSMSMLLHQCRLHQGNDGQVVPNQCRCLIFLVSKVCVHYVRTKCIWHVWTATVVGGSWEASLCIQLHFKCHLCGRWMSKLLRLCRLS